MPVARRSGAPLSAEEDKPVYASRGRRYDALAAVNRSQGTSTCGATAAPDM